MSLQDTVVESLNTFHMFYHRQLFIFNQDNPLSGPKGEPSLKNPDNSEIYRICKLQKSVWYASYSTSGDTSITIC